MSSDELRASKERYNVMKKQLEMEGIVLGRVSEGWEEVSGRVSEG